MPTTEVKIVGPQAIYKGSNYQKSYLTQVLGPGTVVPVDWVSNDPDLIVVAPGARSDTIVKWDWNTTPSGKSAVLTYRFTVDGGAAQEVTKTITYRFAGDSNDDHVVSVADFSPVKDFNENGEVDEDDIGEVIGNFGNDYLLPPNP